MPDESGPQPLLAGHMVVYDGVIAFRPEGAPDEDVVRRPFPAFATALLVSILPGEEPDLASLPNGVAARLAGRAARRG